MRQENDKKLKKLIQVIYRNKHIWLAFMAAFLPRFIFLFQTYPLSIGGDELFAMGPAAKLAGYDWSGVMQNYRYYGYGYTALLIPFFKLIHEPIILYRMMVLMMILAQSVVAPISYHLMRKYLLVDNEKILCISSICCSYLVSVRAVYTYPEFIYILVMWLLTWVLLKMNQTVDEKKGKTLNTLLLILILFYASTVHSRATALWIAAAFGIMYYGWVYRKKLVSIPTCLFVGLGAIVVSKKGIEIVLNYFANATSSGVSNTGVSFSVGYLLEDIKSWPAWVNIIIGQLNEAIVITGGLAVFAVTGILILLWQGLIKNKQDMEELQAMSPYVVVGSVFLAAIVITIAGQSVSWLPGVTNAMQNGGDPDAYRALTYFRYYGAYAGPILMLGIAYFYHKREMFGKLYPVVCIVTALLQGYWVLCILPYISDFNGCSWDFAPYSLTKGFTDEIRLRTYLSATLVVILVLAFSYILYKKKKMHVVLAVLSIMLVYSYCYNAVNHEGYRGQKNYTYVDDSVHMLKQLRKTGDLPGTIYVEDASVEGTGQQTKFLYQFCMLEEPVVSSLPPENEKEALYLCQNKDEHQELAVQGYMCGKIAEHEYIYVTGEDLQKRVQGSGISLE
ncbi:hypothetical protein [Clostridium sp. C105KSO13]|uniref:hypothetical protein n=1 Tax=Clostridium sp. C105KSO13 TaxID=1776045 RepID=UPI00074063B3|nr:hypothetical protein [Clostridium sp. C105KSO13]CUX34366.1 hypothetical protein BN3456_01570 [Clostridium sp. C105KSO13]